MDPISAIGSLCTLIEGGKAVGDLTGKLVECMRSIDQQKAEIMHKEAAGGVTASMRATERLVRKKELEAAEKQLYEVIVNTVGFSAWKELQELRKEEIRADREAAKEIMAKREKQREMIFAIVICVGGTVAIGLIVTMILMF